MEEDKRIRKLAKKFMAHYADIKSFTPKDVETIVYAIFVALNEEVNKK